MMKPYMTSLSIAALMTVALTNVDVARADPKTAIDSAKEAAKTQTEQQKKTADEVQQMSQEDEMIDDESAMGEEDELDMPEDPEIPMEAEDEPAPTKSM